LEILAVVVEGGVVAPLFFCSEILCKTIQNTLNFLLTMESSYTSKVCKTKEKSLDESQKLDLKPPCKTKEENKN